MRQQIKWFAVGLAAVLLLGVKGSVHAEGMRRASSHTTRMKSVPVTAADAVAPEPAGMAAGEVYRLRMHQLHTGEDIDVVYRVGNTYISSGLEKLNHFLRDYRTEDVKDYDPREFDVLHNVLEKLHRPNAVIDIVCGYRTPWSNNFLRTRAAVTGVALHSQHMLAKAIDIRVPGVTTAALRNAAMSLHAGGVGYYPVSQFVHVDVGPVRHWAYGGKGE